jgi:hypothetical protein
MSHGKAKRCQESLALTGLKCWMAASLTAMDLHSSWDYNECCHPTGRRLAITEGGEERSANMTIREALDKVLTDLPEARLWEVLDFARYLRWLEKEAREEFEDWHRLNPAQAVLLEGPDEPGYTEADIKRKYP